jgi:rubredoxin
VLFIAAHSTIAILIGIEACGYPATGQTCKAGSEHERLCRFSARVGGDMKSYMCVICGFVYNEADGLPDEGVAAGTKWDDVPPNWVCPDCGARKEDFEMVEI